MPPRGCWKSWPRAKRRRAKCWNALPDALSTPESRCRWTPAPRTSWSRVSSRSATVRRRAPATIDGLRADWPDGWGLVRASNTTPALVLRFEADNKEALARIKDDFRAHLAKVAPEITATF